MTVKVYHRREPDFSDDPARAKDLWCRDGFKLVAIVTTDSLETAYAMTNSTDCYWPEREGASSHGTPQHEQPWPTVTMTVVGTRHRSTSMGDILVDEDGHRHIVAMFGFTKL